MISALWAFPVGFVLLIVGGMVGVWVGVGLERDHAAEEALYTTERHRHRHGDPQVTTLLTLPQPGRLSLVPLAGHDPDEWRFFGGAVLDPAPGAAEYELLTQAVQATYESPLTVALAETDSGFTRRMAREVDAMIAGWEAQANYDCHTMRAD